MKTVDPMSPFQMASSQSIEIASDRNLVISGDTLDVQADKMYMESSFIQLETTWNGKVGVQTAGGSLHLSQNLFDGASMDNHDLMRGSTLKSPEDISMDAQKSMIVIAESIKIAARQQVHMEAESFHFQPEWNQNIVNHLRGGSLQVDALSFDGASTTSQDKMRGATILSQEDVVVEVGNGKALGYTVTKWKLKQHIAFP